MFRTIKPYYITMGIAVVVMVLCIIASQFMGKSGNKELAAQAQQIQQLNNEIATKSAAISSGNSNVVGAVTGIDLARVQTDNEIAKEFIESITTWSDYNEYVDARMNLIDKYGVQTNSNLLKVFLPEYPDVYDREGNSYNFVDYYKLGCHYRGLKAMVRDITDGVYQYFTIVTCSGVKDGNGGDFNLAMTYSIDTAGNIFGFDAYTLDSHVWVN